MSETKNDIELRSEKVRNIVGQIPNVLLRKGITLISLVIIGVITGLYFIPYPETLTMFVCLYSSPESEIIKAPENGFIELMEPPKNVQERHVLALLKEANGSIVSINSQSRGLLLTNCRDKSYANKGDILFSIVPENIQCIYGIIFISQEKINRIKLGQNVKIELMDSPSKNYGLIDGEISKIYPILENGRDYKVIVHLKDGFKSTNNCKFNYTPLMNAKASVFLSNESFLKRFINSIRKE
jgi:hypothetical protein